ncbi:serine/threonine-protein kinase Nek6-like isoform X2 [Paramacrobiotus metropolitanus]|uniref:serine/threonine-protein kinase Nek6-like isoform X2 n=1 Tax=Paramacrobiotus metropolitanus TaxID=2943436 RepID=UPI00244640F9|nr:serine/threonine-protein kinase Nek6-like isoform X2 [Paramacrobiotus metropolitanus]
MANEQQPKEVSYKYDCCDVIERSVFKAQLTDCDPTSENGYVAVKVAAVPLKSLRNIRLQQQEKILRVLKNKNVVGYQTVVQKRMRPDLVQLEFCMTYHPDGNLRDLIGTYEKQGTMMSAKTMVNFCTQLASGLWYLHRKDIVHGRLKPSAILVSQSTTECNLRIGGLDKMIVLHKNKATADDMDYYRETVRSIMQESTGKYASPEIIQAIDPRTRTIFDQKTDVWSLGCIMVDLARCCFDDKKKHLYNEETNTKKAVNSLGWPWNLTRTAEGHIPYISQNIPTEFTRKILQRCLSKDCNGRFSAEELHNALVRLEIFSVEKTGVRQGAISSNAGVDNGEPSDLPWRDGCRPNIEPGISSPSDWLGKGSFGAVFRGKLVEGIYETLPTTIAIKTVELKKEKLKEFADKTKREEAKSRWEALITLRHLNIVTYYNLTFKKNKQLDGPVIEIVMDYCSELDILSDVWVAGCYG